MAINFLTGQSIDGNLSVLGGSITLGGISGRIQGIVTVLSGTDATSKTYVDNAITNTTGNYLPLSAGSSYPLTGGLHIPHYIYHAGNTGTVIGYPSDNRFLIGTDSVTRVDVTNAGLSLGDYQTNVSVSIILDEDDMASDSATALVTQQSIKAYVDAQTSTGNVTTGGFTSGRVPFANSSVNLDDSANLTFDGSALTIGQPTHGYGTLNTGGQIYIEHQGTAWNETTPGTTRGAIHMDPVGSGANDTGNAITFGASDHSGGTVSDAGIYVRSDGNYGTKMYIATTDSYSVGSKTAITILQTGAVVINRSHLVISTITNSSSDTDKFLVSNNGQVQYRTGAQVLADIGGAPATGGSYLPLAGGVMTGKIKRSSAITGFLEGSYNNVGDNSANTNPIYTIGSSYNPSSTTLSNMYGIGYTHGPNASFITLSGATGWGMYVASDGDARVWLDGGNGNISHSGDLYVGGGDITLAGTGRIQGVDTVSAATDAVNKAYVDAKSVGILTLASANGITVTGGTTANATVGVNYTAASDNLVHPATTITDLVQGTSYGTYFLCANSNPGITYGAVSKIRTGHMRLNDFGAPDGSVNMNAQKIINVATPTGTTDASNKAYVDTKLSLVGGTMSNTNLVTNMNADLLDGVHKPTNFSATSQTYTTIATGQWDLPTGSSVFSKADSVGGPGAVGYWYVTGRRDVSGGYGGIYSSYTSGQHWFGYNALGTANPTWDKIWTDRTFTPGNYLPLTGGTLTGDLTISGDTKDLIIANTAETKAGIVFVDTQAGAGQAAAIKFDCSAETLDFFVNDESTERMSINTSGDLTLLTGDIVLSNKKITGIDELQFNSGILLETSGTNTYLDVLYSSTGSGGIRLYDGDSTIQGYLFGDGGATSSFGLLHGSGSWAVRCLENSYVELRNNDSIKLRTSTTGITVTGNLNVTNVISTGYVGENSQQSRDKLRVWSGSTYTMGFKSGYTFGGLGGDGTGTSDYAMSFQMSNDVRRGWWWGDSSDTDAQGSMALTTDGRLSVPNAMRLGHGTSDTTSPGSSSSPYVLSVYGSYGNRIISTQSIALTVQGGGNTNDIQKWLNTSGTAVTVIDNTGKIGMNVANPVATLDMISTTGGYSSIVQRMDIPSYGTGIVFDRSASGSYNYTAMTFRYNGSSVGGITINTTSISISYSSDYRLKENREDISDAIERVKKLKPVKFNWIKEPGKSKVDGFYAHELAEVVPEAVVGEKDALDWEGNPHYQSIDPTKIVPLLTAALQQAIDKIEALELRINKLEK